MKVNTNISDGFNEISVTINAPELSEEVQDIIKAISNINTVQTQIVATKGNEVYFIDLEKVICFFSKDKYNYVRTKNEIYKVKYKLYELEKQFCQNNFIRISNSCIVNINQVQCFDTSILGSIIVKLKDGSNEKVSRRNVSDIMKLLKERGNLK